MLSRVDKKTERQIMDMDKTETNFEAADVSGFCRLLGPGAKVAHLTKR